MAMRNGCHAALSTQGAAIEAGHLGRGAGLVDENQPRRIELRLRGAPLNPGRRYVGALLLAGVRCFF